MTREIRETCGCGAEWRGGTAYVSEREKFREAHAACRAQPNHLSDQEVRERLDSPEWVADLEVMPVEDHQRLLRAEEEKRETVEAELVTVELRAEGLDVMRANLAKQKEAAESELEEVAQELENSEARVRLLRRRSGPRILEELETELVDSLAGEEDLYERCVRAEDRDGQVAHAAARDTLKEILKLLRDKPATCNDMNKLQVGGTEHGERGHLNG